VEAIHKITGVSKEEIRKLQRDFGLLCDVLLTKGGISSTIISMTRSQWARLIIPKTRGFLA
jgi:hypothetical protein